MQLSVLSDRYAVVRLPPEAAVPDRVPRRGFTTDARTPDELSIICLEAAIPVLAPSHDTDYLRIDAARLDAAVAALRAAGNEVTEA